MRTTLSTALLCALLVGPVTRAVAEEAEDAEITRMAKEHYALGQAAFKAGKYAEAIKELKKAYLLKRLPALLVNIAKTYDAVVVGLHHHGNERHGDAQLPTACGLLMEELPVAGAALLILLDLGGIIERKLDITEGGEIRI